MKKGSGLFLPVEGLMELGGRKLWSRTDTWYVEFFFTLFCILLLTKVLQPQEEVKAFQTRQTKKPVGIPGLAPQPNQSQAPKKKESKPKPKKPEDETVAMEKDLTVHDSKPAADVRIEEKTGGAVDNEKKLKGLRKKLRDIEELAKKDPSQLNPEQQDKLSKKAQVEEEIKELENSK
jgi:hypothetical protein